MADKKEFRFIISAADHASLQIAAVGQKLSTLERSTSRLSKSLGSITDFSKTRVALPAVAFGGYVLKQSADFETATNRVKVLAGYAENFNEEARSSLEKIRDQSRALGKDLKFGPTEVMEAFGQILSVDPNVPNAQDAIKPILQLALAADMVPAAAARMVSAMRAAFKSLSNVEASNLLAKLQSSTSVSVSAFGESLSNFAGQAGLRGESPTASMAAHGTLSKLKVEGSKAGEHFNIILRGLQEILSDPAKQAAASRLGLSKNQLFTKINGEDNLRSIDELLPLFSPLVNRPEIAKLVGNDALSSMQILLTNLPLYKEIKAELDSELLKGAENGAAALQARVSSEGLTGSLMELQGAFEELSIKIGDSGLLSEATRAIKSLEGLVEAIGKLDKQTLSTLTNVGITLIAATGALMTLGAAAGALRNLGLIGSGATVSGGAGLSSILAGSTGTASLSGGAAALGAFPLSLLGVSAIGTAAMYANRDKMFPGQELFKDYSAPKAIDRSAFQAGLGSAAMRARGEEVSTALSSFAKNNFVESQLVRDARLNKTLGISESDLTGSVPPRDGKIIIDFKNVPPGLGVRTEGAVPDFNLDRGKIMVTP